MLGVGIEKSSRWTQNYLPTLVFEENEANNTKTCRIIDRFQRKRSINFGLLYDFLRPGGVFEM